MHSIIEFRKEYLLVYSPPPPPTQSSWHRKQTYITALPPKKQNNNSWVNPGCTHERSTLMVCGWCKTKTKIHPIFIKFASLPRQFASLEPSMTTKGVVTRNCLSPRVASSKSWRETTKAMVSGTGSLTAASVCFHPSLWRSLDVRPSMRSSHPR